MITINTPSDAVHWTQTVTLTGKPFVLRFRYNQRMSLFMLDLLLVDGTVLEAGEMVRCRFPLFPRLVDSRKYAGKLIAFSNNNNEEAPAIGELGEDRRVTLWYFDPGDV